MKCSRNVGVCVANCWFRAQESDNDWLLCIRPTAKYAHPVSDQQDFTKLRGAVGMSDQQDFTNMLFVT